MAAGLPIIAADVGPCREVLAGKKSLTARYLTGEKGREPRIRRTPVGWLLVEDLTLRNLDRLSVKIPRQVLVAVSGVSGAGKSTLVLDGLVPLGEQYLYPAARRTQGKVPGKLSGMDGIRALKVVDGGAIGTSDWATPATYTGIWDLVRDLFAATRIASERGWKKWRFSFHSREARCAVCEGKGRVKVSMHFLSDVDLPCEACAGRRFNEETLSVRFKGKNVAEVLAMDATSASEFFDFHAVLAAKCRLLAEVGLGYLALGQPSSTLSSGENQRLRLARELGETPAGRTSGKEPGKNPGKNAGNETLYVLDEPTVGLHTADVERLMAALHRLVDRGHTVVVIEHNLDVLRGADYLIDLGPEAGAGGGRVVAAGTPEEVAGAKGSVTGRYLK